MRQPESSRRFRFCRRRRLSLSRRSRDDLRLPGLAGRLGAALSDGQGPRRGLAVQAEAADEVLQDRAFGFPLLWRRERKRKEKIGRSDVPHLH